MTYTDTDYHNDYEDDYALYDDADIVTTQYCTDNPHNYKVWLSRNTTHGAELTSTAWHKTQDEYTKRTKNPTYTLYAAITTTSLAAGSFFMPVPTLINILLIVTATAVSILLAYKLIDKNAYTRDMDNIHYTTLRNKSNYIFYIISKYHDIKKEYGDTGSIYGNGQTIAEDIEKNIISLLIRNNDEDQKKYLETLGSIEKELMKLHKHAATLNMNSPAGAEGEDILDHLKIMNDMAV